jgi:hypothetical protein
MGIPASFISIINFFDGAFECGGISKSCSYVWTNAELLRIEFCNFVQCHIFVSYLSLCFIKGVLSVRDINIAPESTRNSLGS